MRTLLTTLCLAPLMISGSSWAQEPQTQTRILIVNGERYELSEDAEVSDILETSERANTARGQKIYEFTSLDEAEIEILVDDAMRVVQQTLAEAEVNFAGSIVIDLQDENEVERVFIHGPDAPPPPPVPHDIHVRVRANIDHALAQARRDNSRENVRARIIRDVTRAQAHAERDHARELARMEHRLARNEARTEHDLDRDMRRVFIEVEREARIAEAHGRRAEAQGRRAERMGLEAGVVGLRAGIEALEIALREGYVEDDNGRREITRRERREFRENIEDMRKNLEDMEEQIAELPSARHIASRMEWIERAPRAPREPRITHGSLRIEESDNGSLRVWENGQELTGDELTAWLNDTEASRLAGGPEND
ncbi:hypothetical protein [Woodsholea maritima]|uniref:hypothetical protein n=1 Tax=Woodsholea maritima TaxID=240237 RepID=UPI00036A5E19|nr:hypothetical protein [Woodsholea maritima]